MAFRQLNLDSLPIDSLVDVNSIDYKYQLNLAFNSAQVLYNIDNRLSELSKNIDLEPNTVATLNTTLETYLYLLLTTTTISNLDNSKLTSYFCKKKKIDSNYFQAVNSDYLEKLQFTNYKVWGSNCGTLGYYLYLSQSSLHYASPSQLVRLACTELIKSLELETFSTNLLALLTSDKETDDYKLYESSFTLLKELDLVKAINQLTFYEQWVKKVIVWYSSSRVNDYPQNSSAYKSFNFLLAIVREISKQGLYLESFSNLPYKFVHQDIDLLVLDIIQFIITQRKQQEFEVTTDITQEEKLVSELFNQLKVKNTVSLVTEKSYSWLSVNLSGGINLWLTAVAAELINRAYILTHSTNTSYSNQSIYVIEESGDYLKLLSRVNKLLFYAGYCLKKTNLNHLQLLGSNLRTLSGLDESINLEEYNLLT